MIFQHTAERPLALSDDNGARLVVVGDVDGGVSALLVVVVGSLILVDLELTVASCIYIKVD